MPFTKNKTIFFVPSIKITSHLLRYDDLCKFSSLGVSQPILNFIKIEDKLSIATH